MFMSTHATSIWGSLTLNASSFNCILKAASSEESTSSGNATQSHHLYIDPSECFFYLIQIVKVSSYTVLTIPKKWKDKELYQRKEKFFFFFDSQGKKSLEQCGGLFHNPHIRLCYQQMKYSIQKNIKKYFQKLSKILNITITSM